MINSRLILRHNRATAELNEYLLNEARYIRNDTDVLPTVIVDCLVATPLGEMLPVKVEMCEGYSEEIEGNCKLGCTVSQIDKDGVKHVLFVTCFDTSTMTTLQAIMSAGHLAGDFIKFYFKGGK